MFLPLDLPLHKGRAYVRLSDVYTLKPNPAGTELDFNNIWQINR